MKKRVAFRPQGETEPVTAAFDGCSAKAVVVGADTAIGAAVAAALAREGLAVVGLSGEGEHASLGRPADCNRVVYCHDASRDAEGHIAGLEALCRELAATVPAGKQVRVCVFTPATACAETRKGPIREASRLEPRSRRDLAHCEAEMLLHAWFGLSKGTILPTVIRHGELYGAPDESRPLAGHASASLRRAQRKERLLFPGLGLQKRTLTHLDDFAAAAAAILKQDRVPAVTNVPGETMAVADYLCAICARFGVEGAVGECPPSDDLPWGLGDRVLSSAAFKAAFPAFRLRHTFRDWLEKL